MLFIYLVLKSSAYFMSVWQMFNSPMVNSSLFEMFVLNWVYYTFFYYSLSKLICTTFLRDWLDVDYVPKKTKRRATLSKTIFIEFFNMARTFS